MKIALVGSAPSSIRLAPYQDAEWQIYGCSPGLYGVAPRVTEWFEMHLWEPGQPWFSPEYVQWLTALPGRGVVLWTGAPVASVPGSQAFPWHDVLEEFDPNHWFCSSSLFWMMARAMNQIRAAAANEGRPIDFERDKIGFWGVDMAAGEEYEMQRAGIHHLTYIARQWGIEVGAPPESDLFTPRFKYGVDEWTHSYRKMRARRAELEQRLHEAEAQSQATANAAHFLKGAIEDLGYMHNTWADKADHCGPRAMPVPKPPAPRIDINLHTPLSAGEMEPGSIQWQPE